MSLSDPWTGPERLTRCYACSQENCGYGPCSCDCHGPKTAPVTIKQAKMKVMNRIQLYQELAALEAIMGASKCQKHPKYEAKRKPRTACESCWRKWIALHP